MRLRRLGRTGLAVSELSFGTGAIAMADPMEASAAIACALDAGINGFEIDAGDVAAATLLGQVFAREGARHRVHVFARATSRVRFDLPSPHVPAGRAYPGAHLRAEAEALLARLGVERLALLQLHAWCPEWLHEGDWRAATERLRGDGKIAGMGVSLFDHDVDAGLEAVASGAVDAVQVMANIFDPSAAAALFPLCQRHDVGVIARSPFYYGALAGRCAQSFGPSDWRDAYFYAAHRRETEERVRALGPAAAATALRFGLSHPAVSTVAVGMRSRTQVEANAAAEGEGPLDAKSLAALARHKWLC
jgi:aryl-alcohol dehydrogenase-like predicted oxidoreductase